jgi:peptidoglycan/xylan/chitin deacetylase (PgdA/CDA1 family)
MESWLAPDRAVVSLTFDVDGDAGFERRGFADALSRRSEATFGVERGLPRVLELLREYGVSATFYVPGEVVDRHPEAILAILVAGHEVGHHGYQHLSVDAIDADAQRRELEDGVTAMETKLGVRPVGYRAPSWELTPFTLQMLLEHGFAYDSSLMGDDRPYVVQSENGELLEFPVHWSLDDFPFFGFRRAHPAAVADPESVRRIWIAEFESACADQRHITYTMHPALTGRGYAQGVLRGLIEHVQDSGQARFATHREVAAMAVAGES